MAERLEGEMMYAGALCKLQTGGGGGGEGEGEGEGGRLMKGRTCKDVVQAGRKFGAEREVQEDFLCEKTMETYIDRFSAGSGAVQTRIAAK
jgi:hypothetical protein